jgi:hypothetical protein
MAEVAPKAKEIERKIIRSLDRSHVNIKYMKIGTA